MIHIRDVSCDWDPELLAIEREHFFGQDVRVARRSGV